MGRVPKWALRAGQAIVVVSAAAVAGCFNGGTPTTSPAVPAVTTAPFSASTGAPIVNSGSTTYTGPTGGGFTTGFTAALSTPAPGQSATLTVTIGATPPPGVPAASSILRRNAESETRDALAAAIYGVLYLQYTASQTTTETGNPVFTIGLPTNPAYPTSGALYYLAILQGSTWQYGYAPGVLNGNTLTLTGSYPITFAANLPVNFFLYYQSSSDPTPSPPPQPTPTAVPTGNAGVGLH
jgi:hypothetical protein